mgnify:CR=1 FL=1
MSKLRNMLYTSAIADKAKAQLTLELLENHDDRLAAIDKYLTIKKVI